MKKVVVDSIENALKELKIKIERTEIENTVEIPPNNEMGDFAFPCFFIAKILKQNPSELAEQIRKKIGNTPVGIKDIQTKGPYLNFFVDNLPMVLELNDRVRKEKDDYGKPMKLSKNKTMVEFPSPNTNKPLHMGHLRNMAIGESVSKILEFNGEKVIRANLNNDRGIHICKSMAAYMFYGKNKTPKTAKKKSDHFVGDYYVMFNEKSKKNEKLEIESHRLLQQWEAGDKKVLALWKKMNKWALDGFNETYKLFGIKHDVEYFESNIYEKGKETILQGLKDKVFEKRKDGAIIINLKKEGLDEKVLLRIDGTSVYITQDLYLAKLKFEQYKLNKSIYVVGNEQNYHFDVLFNILKKLGFNQSGLFHLSYGMVNLPEGRMKSREGTVVDADDLIEKVQSLVKKELSSRTKISKRELEKRSLTIALAAIKYILLRVDSKKDMIFNPKESVNFEGETGTYILYSYARAGSILKKVSSSKAHSKSKKETFSVEPKLKLKSLEPSETELAKKLMDFSNVVQKSYNQLNPSLIANYSYQIAKAFNEFYHNCPVKGSEKETFRLNLVESFRQILKNALNLIGIETLEVM